MGVDGANKCITRFVRASRLVWAKRLTIVDHHQSAFAAVNQRPGEIVHVKVTTENGEVFLMGLVTERKRKRRQILPAG